MPKRGQDSAAVDKRVRVGAAVPCERRVEIFETEPRELGSALAEVHLWLCQVHDRVPLELAARLAKLVGGMLAGRPVWTCRRGMPTFWAWRDWSSSRRYVTGRFDDGARTAAFQRP